MGKNRKPRKAYRPRGIEPAAGLRLQPWRLNMLFNPVERILDRLEAGDAFDLNEDGELETQYHEVGHAFSVDMTIHTLIEVYEIAAMRAPAKCPGIAPLRHLRSRLADDEGLTSADIEASRSCLAALRRYAASLPSTELIDVMRTLALKAQLDDAEKPGAAS